MSFLRNRIAMALFGLIVFSTLGAIAMTRPPATTSTNATATTQGASSNAPTPTIQPTATTASAIVNPTPIDVTSHATETPTPTLTPTSTSAPQTVLRGTIGTITTTNGGSFTLNVSGGGTKTVVVDSKTRYQGVNNFGQLRGGMSATVTGSAATGGNFLATTVQVQTDN